MALNLNTLTNASTSGDVLAEALTTADFLENVPVLRNLARGSQKGGDAKQGTALNQPKALPLDANGKGYCYLPVTTGNAPAVTFPAIGANDDFVLEMVAYIVNVEDFHVVSGSSLHRILIYNTGGSPSFQYRDGSNNNNASLSGSLSAGLSTLRFEKTGSTLVFKQNGAVKGTINNITAAPTFTHLSFNGQFSTSRLPLNGYIQSVTLSINGTEQLNIDFTASHIRHGDTKFKCATGQVVTVNQSGNDPATVIKKSVLRFDGANDGLNGLLNQTITDGYMFAAFSVLGTGGETWGRMFSINSTGASDATSTGFQFVDKNSSTNDLATYYNGSAIIQTDLFDENNGDILVESKLTSTGIESSVNNAAPHTLSVSTTVSAEEFNIAVRQDGVDQNTAIDLEFLALFPATITDAQADSVRNYINNRNNVFSLIDSQGYYFFDPQIFPIVDPADFVSYWNGNIVGSDNTLNASVSQSTVNDQPTRDGYKVTFNDNADHLVVASPLSGGQAGWQIVGTSLGTFVYRVDNDAVTELNLLGNFGSTFRKTGDLYGIILLPESASSADIESARKLLIDRGASDGDIIGISFSYAWLDRTDIVEFKSIRLSNTINFTSAWHNSTSLSSFGAIDASNGSNFSSAWRGTSALTSFPSGAKLGTEATNVNFTSAWQSSGLTSFPALDLSNGINMSYAFYNATSLSSFGAIDARVCTNFFNAFNGCSALTSFPAGAKLGTEAINVNFNLAWMSSGLTSFPAALDLSKGSRFIRTWKLTPLASFSTKLPKSANCLEAWQGCSSLVDFSADVFTNWNPASIDTAVFNDTWDGCSALSAQSVENILVSIDASGKYATTNGASGGSALSDAGIDIDYNTATGSLSAATNTAIDSLSGKGWEVFINGVLVIPNILDLEPAAAYSLRSFDSDLDPNVVNVRRSSDNATSDFKASEVSDGTLVAFVGAGNDGHVTTWYDQGGTNHATQSTAASQPLLVESGALVTQNSKPLIYFDGNNDSFSIPAGLISNLDTLLVSAVLTNSDGNNDYGVVLGEPNNRIYVPYVSSNNLSIGYHDSAVKLQDGAYSNGFQLITLSVDASTASGFKNGQAFSTVATATASNNAPTVTTNANRIGAFGSQISGSFDFSEVVIFNTDQSANRTGIEANINDTYTIY